ncbi:Luciferase family oxidoreductase, group 1 [Frankia sp. AiPs1]|uniref:LLM class flavin-dependent oxidoreductase n=1 Tax=Frankia sp. AiPa1 TaxID=573492 RepID=UPI00202AC867|nr:LLM class flavin-dependent oxidoreductase [Frankia sp. AiPa1]MCL9760557.1 LLM class flavin-dependent oxidoreductase [Frankia sp. AiPa1]
MVALSFVDQGPTSAETPGARSLRHSVALAQLADELGYTRYWVAEHHGVRNMTIAAPEILIAHIAERTSRLRVGSGGIMLPNHSPLHVAEQFRTLEALYPGRIDLGIGRSTGTGDDPTRDALLRTPDGLDRFDEHLRQLLAVGGRGDLPADDPYRGLIASPAAVPLPPVFLLGASVRSARLAGQAGLGYGFLGVYQDPAVAIEALRAYRASFVPRVGALRVDAPDADVPGADVPGAKADRPTAILAVRVWVGEDDEHAAALAAPERLAVLDYLTGNPSPLESVERALARRLTDAQLAKRETLDARGDVTGGVERVAARLAELADASGADEIMAISNIHDPEDRRDSLRRLALAAGLRPAPAAPIPHPGSVPDPAAVPREAASASASPDRSA